MGELDRFAQASPKWMNSAAETVIGVNLHGARKVTLQDSSGNEAFSPSNPASVKISNGTNTADVVIADGSYGLVTVTPGHISTPNSYVGTLSAGGTFTGTAEEVINHGVIQVFIATVARAITFYMDFSTDNNTWYTGDTYTIAIGTDKTFSFQCAARYFRIRLVNGILGSTVVTLQTILKPNYVKPSSHRIGDSISSDDDAELVKSVLTANNGTTFTPITSTPSNNLRVTDAESGLAIARGQVVGTNFIHKFGKAFDFDTSDNEVTIWDGAEDGEAWELMRYIYSTSANIDSISSSNATDTEIISITGQTADGTEVVQTATLNGQTRVALGTPLYRVYRAYNATGTPLVGHTVVYVNTALTAGVPTDKTKIRLVIHPGYEQTEMAVYTIPLGYTGYLVSFYASTSGASKSSNYVINLDTREPDKVFRVKHSDAISDTGTSKFQHNYFAPEKLLERTDIELTVQATAVGVTSAAISGGFEIILVAN